MMTVSHLQIKAESLFINSIGHRPMEYVTPPIYQAVGLISN